MELRRSTRFAVSKPTLDASAAKRATNETRDIAAPVNDQNGSHASESSELAARTNLGNVTARVTEVHANARLTYGSSCDTVFPQHIAHEPSQLDAERIVSGFNAPRVSAPEESRGDYYDNPGPAEMKSPSETAIVDIEASRLTREYIQADDTCSSASELHRLLGIIFLFSDCHPQPKSYLEQVAGFRYFTPDGGALAYEWARFFDIAPSRFLTMTPTEVQLAYQTTKDEGGTASGTSFEEYLLQSPNCHKETATNCTIKAAVGDHGPSNCFNMHTQGVLTSSGQSTQKLSAFTTPQNSAQRKRKISMELEKAAFGSGTSAEEEEAFVPSFERPCKGARLCEDHLSNPYSRNQPIDWYEQHYAVASPAPFGFTAHIPSQSWLTDPERLRRIVHGAAGLDAPMPTSMQSITFDTTYDFPLASDVIQYQGPPQQGQLAAGIGTVTKRFLPANPPATLQRAPISVTAPLALVNVALPPINNGPRPPRLPKAYTSGAGWVNPHPNAPAGSMTIRGGGNRKMAWNLERKRIFNQVEGWSINQLPPSANSPYATEMFSRTPQSVDPRCCPFATTMEENLVYMTGAATLNREMCLRTKKQWTASDCVYYVVQAHDLQTDTAYERTKIQHHFRACADTFEKSRPNHHLTASLRNCNMESGLVGENSVPHDYYLYAMGDGVVQHPQGRAAQMLTRVIRHVREVTQDRNVLLSQAAAYAARHTITVPGHLVMTSNLTLEDQPPRALISAAKSSYIRKFRHSA